MRAKGPMLPNSHPSYGLACFKNIAILYVIKNLLAEHSIVNFGLVSSLTLGKFDKLIVP